MAKLSAVVRPKVVNKEGKCIVQIALSHKGQTAYIGTGIYVAPANFRDGIVTKKEGQYMTMNNKIAQMLDEYQAKLDKVVRTDIYSASDLKKLVTAEVAIDNKNMTYAEWSIELEKQLIKMGRESTAKLRKLSRERFTMFGGNVCLCDITPMMLQNFKVWMGNYEKDAKRKKKVLIDNDGHGKLLRYVEETYKVKAWKAGTISQTLGIVRAVINAAIKARVVKYEVSPVDDLNIQKPRQNKMWIKGENFGKFLTYEPGEGKGDTRKIAVDLLLLSFYLGGMNMGDMLNIKYDLKSTKVEYVRIKTQNRTKEEQVITLPFFPKAKRIVKKYIDADGKLGKGIDNLHKAGFNRWLNTMLKKAAIELGIDERVCHNTARKSFSQYAMNLGCDMSVINYVIGHSDERPRGLQVMEYYTEVTFEQSFLCMKRVFDYVDNPEKYDSAVRKMMMKELMCDI